MRWVKACIGGLRRGHSEMRHRYSVASPTRTALLTGLHFVSYLVTRSLIAPEKTPAHRKSGTTESRSSLQNWEKSFSSRDLP